MTDVVFEDKNRLIGNIVECKVTLLIIQAIFRKRLIGNIVECKGRNACSACGLPSRLIGNIVECKDGSGFDVFTPFDFD